MKIGNRAFYECPIENFVIPFRTTEIGERAFENCRYLENILISEDSELKVIGQYALASTSIKSIVIPKNVNKIGYRCFDKTDLLQIIEFADNSELQLFDNIEFYRCPKTVVIMTPYKLEKLLTKNNIKQ